MVERFSQQRVWCLGINTVQGLELDADPEPKSLGLWASRAFGKFGLLGCEVYGSVRACEFQVLLRREEEEEEEEGGCGAIDLSAWPRFHSP